MIHLRQEADGCWRARWTRLRPGWRGWLLGQRLPDEFFYAESLEHVLAAVQSAKSSHIDTLGISGVE